MRHTYRVMRSVLFSAFLVVLGLYLLLYIVISIPAVQDSCRRLAVRELSALFGSRMEIGSVDFSPFNRLEISNVSLWEPPCDGKPANRCVHIDKVGAGISLWKLLRGEIVVTYAEIIGLDAAITQAEKGSPLNIDFIIKAFEPKDKTKPPTHFHLQIRNIVVRKCSASFDRLWLPRVQNPYLIDFNHLTVSNLRTDLIINSLTENSVSVNLRRLAFTERSGLTVEKLAFQGDLTPESLSIRDFELQLPSSVITYDSFSQSFPSIRDFASSFSTTDHDFRITNWKITPADLSCFYSPLSTLTEPVYISLKASGNPSALEVADFGLAMANEELSLSLRGTAADLLRSPAADIGNLRLKVGSGEVRKLLTLAPGIKQDVADILTSLGDISFTAKGNYSKAGASAEGKLESTPGELDFNALYSIDSRRLKADVSTPGFDLGILLPKSGAGAIALEADADISFGNTIPTGEANVDIDWAYFRNTFLEDIKVSASNDGELARAIVSSAADAVSLNLDATLIQAGEDSQLALELDIDRFAPGAFGLLPKMPDAEIEGNVRLSATGSDADNLTGTLEINDAAFADGDGRTLRLHSLLATAASAPREIQVRSDFADLDLTGTYTWNGLAASARDILGTCLPDIFTANRKTGSAAENQPNQANLTLTLQPDAGLYDFLRLPVRVLVPTTIKATLDSEAGLMNLSTSVPYLQQGKNKLLRDILLTASASRSTGCSLDASLLWPAAKGDVALGLNATAFDDRADLDVKWKFDKPSAYDGEIGMTLNAYRSPMSTRRDRLSLNVRPATFHINGAKWTVEPTTVTYYDNAIRVPRLRVWHDGQFVDISGIASPSADDRLTVSLRDIDLGYIFETLNINFVTFSGIASGKVTASQLLSGTPRAATDSHLAVKDFGYNAVRLGDADLSAAWQHEDMRLAIGADIRDRGRHTATVDGGVWLGRDSLGFNFDTHGINAAFVQPFLKNFIEELEGRATGNLTLFGTFKDVDLKGDIVTDSVRVKIGFTNVSYYSDGDSLHFRPGLIDIPGLRVKDKYGHRATFGGTVRHDYFRDAYPDLRVRNARNLLCFDTDATMNPDWYGTVFGTGNVAISGNPHETRMLIDMQTDPGSAFTFVLNNTAAAGEFDFLTFSDRRREKYEREHPADSIPDFVSAFRRRTTMEQSNSSDFRLDLRATVNPTAKVTLVMDPVAGDKITANGSGALQLGYDAESDDITLYGTYTLDKGTYNFSLQDLILKDFNIKPGSSITFNGDPMSAVLDIKAAYRVNTNLADLDKSFSQDRELNRTNVPVEAILNVDGDLTRPDITFDIELPTLTSDVARKVRSIISTDDMMNRQIIYLLALNRFYTPEYMGSTATGGEIASVASATVSSQLRNMLGQLTDKLDIAPSFRTDKGDFSDVEVDLALSSSLLNNRLLINGNFGYRDRSTSNTTFVGDFDLEYLLNRAGTLRLKAYNHFNDQNYYLKSSLTTQGLGVLWRRDFDRIRLKKQK